MPLLIGPGFVATIPAVLPDGGVLVDRDRIIAVDHFDVLRQQFPAADWLDAQGALILPGLTNAHTHLYGLFARGFDFPDPPPRSFRQILERVWWRLDKALTHEAVYLSAAISLADCLRSGVTAVCDHHASPGAIAGSLREIARAARTVGIRTCLAYEVTDRDGPDKAQEGIAENLRFIQETAGSPLLAAKFGLHAAFTLSDQTLAACRQAAASLGGGFPGFHIHLAEGPEDPADSLLRSGQRTAHRLAAAGILGPRTFVGHGVHLDEEEIALLASTQTILTHQPQSNMANAVGRPRILHMHESGVPTALGTDGYTSDMLETLRAAATLHSHATGIPSAGVTEFTNILLQNNPAILSGVFGLPLGHLEPGAAADLVITSYHPPTALTAATLPSHLFYGLTTADVDTVIVAGQVVVRNHRLTLLNEADVAREARTVATAIRARI